MRRPEVGGMKCVDSGRYRLGGGTWPLSWGIGFEILRDDPKSLARAHQEDSTVYAYQYFSLYTLHVWEKLLYQTYVCHNSRGFHPFLQVDPPTSRGPFP